MSTRISYATTHSPTYYEVINEEMVRGYHIQRPGIFILLSPYLVFTYLHISLALSIWFVLAHKDATAVNNCSSEYPKSLQNLWHR